MQYPVPFSIDVSHARSVQGKRFLRCGCVVAGCLALAAGLARHATAQEIGGPTFADVPNCYTVVAAQADMPALEAGVIRDIPVHEGQQVAQNDLLLQLDDRKAVADEQVAEAKYNAAKAKADDDINIRYSVAAADVAKAEYESAVKGNQDVPNSTPRVKMNELLLKCTETKLAIEKARLDRNVAEKEAAAAQAEVEAAKVTIDRHKLLSPISGVVQAIRSHKGESVQPNQPVIRVMQLDTLWVEGHVSPEKYARSDLDGRECTVDATIIHHGPQSFRGKVIFVDPMTENDGSYIVRAKIENVKDKESGAWLLYPLMTAEMHIKLR